MKIGWRGALGFLLSAVLLVWALRGVPIHEVGTVLRQSNVALFVLSALVGTTIFPLRAMRWKVILEPVAEDLHFAPLWRSTAIGMMVNNVVPARAGEFARAYALTREDPRVRFTTAFASLAVDRLFDAVVLVLLLALAMFLPSFPADTRIGGQPIERYAILAGIIAVAGLGVLAVIALYPERVLRIFDRLAARLSPKAAAKARSIVMSFITGLGALRSPLRFARVFAWTVVHWLVNALGFWIGFKAVGIDAPYAAALFLQGIIAVGVTVPSTPGFVGVFEFFARAGLMVYGVNENLAVSWAIGFHILSFLPITLIGLYYFARLGLRFGELGSAAARQT